MQKANKINILDQLAAHARERVETARSGTSLKDIRAMTASLPKGRGAFETAIRSRKIRGEAAFICECKKASPSKGVIDKSFPYMDIACAYDRAGADCISVLTEPKWFLGSDAYLREIAAKVKTPCIRKDFVVDEYMLHEARLLGASAVLLICSILSDAQLREYLAICEELGLSALTEAHDEDEIMRAVEAGSRIIGVNNRNLKDFSVDTGNSARLRKLVPDHVLFVAESGITAPSDTAALRMAGADAFLIGEALMRAERKDQMLRAFRTAANEAVRQKHEKKPAPFIKLCGMRREEDIASVNRLRPDMVGYIFTKKSHRYIDPKEAARLTGHLAGGIIPVGVFVDADPEMILELASKGTIRAVQLHGKESKAYISLLRSALDERVPLIKAFKITCDEDVAMANRSPADLILLDSGDGGTGKVFDHSLLKGIERPYILAGGLDSGNIGSILKELEDTPLAGVDVSSGIETGGWKDPLKMEAFTKAVRGSYQ
ncbi:MAG: indole-3-glycerol phosphate synthase TrpC [Lachnospiraceae bacterium]|nr:indole-3-glycerol phosphate synthase TrpC [Lachnospiraceae bacterium]